METGFWRPQPDGGLEVVLCHPDGFAEVWYGTVTGAKIELATDAVVRTASAEDYSAGQRLYGNVEGDLLWTFDKAAGGHPLQYAPVGPAPAGVTPEDLTPAAGEFAGRGAIDLPSATRPGRRPASGRSTPGPSPGSRRRRSVLRESAPAPRRVHSATAAPEANGSAKILL